MNASDGEYIYEQHHVAVERRKDNFDVVVSAEPLGDTAIGGKKHGMRPNPPFFRLAIAGSISVYLFAAPSTAAITGSPSFHGAPIGRCGKIGDVHPCVTSAPRGAAAASLSLTGGAVSDVDPLRHSTGLDPTRDAVSGSRETATSAAFLACIDRAGGMTGAMLDCGSTEIARIDVRLNIAYRRLLTMLPARKAADLRASQRAWLRHHLAETRRLAAAPDNGSLAFIDSQRFELQDLGERTILLERMIARRR